MRDIPKWRSQKAVWVPFFISIDMSVWITLKSVLEADSAKQLHFQKTTDVSAPEPAANTQAPPKSADDTGTSIYWAFDPSLFFTFLHTSFSESDDGGADSSSGDDESGGRKSVSSHGYITGQLFLNMHHVHKLLQEMLLARLLDFYTTKRQFCNDVDFFFPFSVSNIPFVSFFFKNTMQVTMGEHSFFTSANSSWRAWCSVWYWLYRYFFLFRR